MEKSTAAFRTIGEVAEWLDEEAHVLRFWESKFPQIKPVKRAGGRRYYRPDDMMLLGGLKKLLHDDGMTIKGTQKILRTKGVDYVSSFSRPLPDVNRKSDMTREDTIDADMRPAPTADAALEEPRKTADLSLQSPPKMRDASAGQNAATAQDDTAEALILTPEFQTTQADDTADNAHAEWPLKPTRQDTDGVAADNIAAVAPASSAPSTDEKPAEAKPDTRSFDADGPLMLSEDDHIKAAPAEQANRAAPAEKSADSAATAATSPATPLTLPDVEVPEDPAYKEYAGRHDVLSKIINIRQLSKKPDPKMLEDVFAKLDKVAAYKR